MPENSTVKLRRQTLLEIHASHPEIKYRKEFFPLMSSAGWQMNKAALYNDLKIIGVEFGETKKKERPWVHGKPNAEAILPSQTEMEECLAKRE